MEEVLSADGTRIAYQQVGQGPPLVLVHGTGASAARWQRVMPALAERFTVFSVDRRGRGASGDSADYAIEREFEDIAALVAAQSEPVNLLGHSYGGICALEAARLVPNLRRLILYEPPIPVEGAGLFVAPSSTIERLEALLAAGDRAGVLTTFMREIVRMPADELDLFQASPFFPARMAAAHTLPREVRAHGTYRFQPETFRDFQVPTRLLRGGDSPAYFRDAIELVAASLPQAEVALLPGQQHIAMDTAPELFVGAVREFLEAP
jgi:pimeloyl-ACP methyl ester carboxylesterase